MTTALAGPPATVSVYTVAHLFKRVGVGPSAVQPLPPGGRAYVRIIANASGAAQAGQDYCLVQGPPASGRAAAAARPGYRLYAWSGSSWIFQDGGWLSCAPGFRYVVAWAPPAGTPDAPPPPLAHQLDPSYADSPLPADARAQRLVIPFQLDATASALGITQPLRFPQPPPAGTASAVQTTIDLLDALDIATLPFHDAAHAEQRSLWAQAAVVQQYREADRWRLSNGNPLSAAQLQQARAHLDGNADRPFDLGRYQSLLNAQRALQTAADNASRQLAEHLARRETMDAFISFVEPDPVGRTGWLLSLIASCIDGFAFAADAGPAGFATELANAFNESRVSSTGGQVTTWSGCAAALRGMTCSVLGHDTGEGGASWVDHLPEPGEHHEGLNEVEWSERASKLFELGNGAYKLIGAVQKHLLRAQLLTMRADLATTVRDLASTFGGGVRALVRVATPSALPDTVQAAVGLRSDRRLAQSLALNPTQFGEALRRTTQTVGSGSEALRVLQRDAALGWARLSAAMAVGNAFYHVAGLFADAAHGRLSVDDFKRLTEDASHVLDAYKAYLERQVDEIRLRAVGETSTLTADESRVLVESARAIETEARGSFATFGSGLGRFCFLLAVSTFVLEVYKFATASANQTADQRAAGAVNLVSSVVMLGALAVGGPAGIAIGVLGVLIVLGYQLIHYWEHRHDDQAVVRIATMRRAAALSTSVARAPEPYFPDVQVRMTGGDASDAVRRIAVTARAMAPIDRALGARLMQDWIYYPMLIVEQNIGHTDPHSVSSQIPVLFASGSLLSGLSFSAGINGGEIFGDIAASGSLAYSYPDEQAALNTVLTEAGPDGQRYYRGVLPPSRLYLFAVRANHDSDAATMIHDALNPRDGWIFPANPVPPENCRVVGLSGPLTLQLGDAEGGPDVARGLTVTSASAAAG